MPSDFGDESGEKLFDWMVRVGQEAGQAAMSHGAARVSMAFRNSVGEIGREGAALANPPAARDGTGMGEAQPARIQGAARVRDD